MIPGVKSALLTTISALLDWELLIFGKVRQQTIFLLPLLIEPLRISQHFSQGMSFDPKVNLTWKLASYDVPKGWPR